MHTEMWENAATQSNIETLMARGVNIVWPAAGRLTGEDSGIGRLAEPKEIFESGLATLQGPLTGVRVLVTAGGTREPIDAVRFLGNFSSGKQGVAFAKAARLLGAQVELIAANIDQEITSGLKTTDVGTAKELGAALQGKLGSFDLLVMAAAVADFRPIEQLPAKLKRSETGDVLDLTFVANPDLLSEAVISLRQLGSKAVVIGFAAEASQELERLGKEKLEIKGCDFIVANDISGGSIFGNDQTSVVLVSAKGTEKFEGSKQAVAKGILTKIATNIREL